MNIQVLSFSQLVSGRNSTNPAISLVSRRAELSHPDRYSNGDLFTCENNLTCLRAKAHLVFHWCLYNRLGYLSLDMHYLFLLKAQSLLQATLSENCLLLILFQYVSSHPYSFNVSKESPSRFINSFRVEELSKQNYNHGQKSRGKLALLVLLRTRKTRIQLHLLNLAPHPSLDFQHCIG